MNSIQLVALNTFREIIRNKILFSVFAFAILLLVISALFGSVTVGDRLSVIKDFGLFALSFSGTLVVILAGVNLLDRELRQKTIYNLLSKSIERYEFVIGKFLGLVLVSSVLTSLMGLIFIGFAAGFEGRVDWKLFEGLFLVLCEVLLLSAVTIFFSSVVITTTLAGLFTFGTYLAGHSHRALDYFVDTQADFSSAGARTFARAVKFILPDLGLFNVTDALLYGNGITTQYALMSLVYAVGFAFVFILLSVIIFRFRDFQ